MSAVANMLNAACREMIPLSGREPIDTFSQNTVLYSKLYKNKRNYTGGTSDQGDIRETLRYRPLPGGPHVKGGTFTNVAVSTVQPMFHSIKYMEVTVVVNKIDAMVIARSGGSRDVLFDIVKNVLHEGMDSLGKYAEVGVYLPGQGASYSAGMNGLSEICNDNTNNNAIGGTITNYGGLSRANADYGFAVKGKTLNVNGAITHRVLLKSLKDVTVDNVGPSFGLTTPDCVVFIEDRFQPGQRFSGTLTGAETNIGIPGWKFHNKVVFETRYAPGSWISGATAATGENRIAYEYIKRVSEQSGTALSAYPTITGETFYWLNTDDKYMHLYVSTAPVFNFGFDDFVPDQNTDDLVGRFRLAANIAAIDNRRQYELNQIKV
jgi:hypothetical protein